MITRNDNGMIERPKFKDVQLDDETLDDYLYIEPKYDGMWAEIHVDRVAQKIKVYSRHAGLKKIYTFEELGLVRKNLPNMILFGEYLFGQHWGEANGMSGQIWLFDVAFCEQKNDALWDNSPEISDWSNVSLQDRKGKLGLIFKQYFSRGKVSELNIFHLVPAYINWDLNHREQLWQELVITKGYEGLVFKNPEHTWDEAVWPRVKRVFTTEYVCMGFNEGGGKYEGMAGSVIGGLYNKDGTLQVVCNVGGLSDVHRKEYWDNKDAYIGRVFEAKGMGLFPSGALRHPSFVGWREDKAPAECLRYA